MLSYCLLPLVLIVYFIYETTNIYCVLEGFVLCSGATGNCRGVHISAGLAHCNTTFVALAVGVASLFCLAIVVDHSRVTNILHRVPIRLRSELYIPCYGSNSTGLCPRLAEYSIIHQVALAVECVHPVKGIANT